MPMEKGPISYPYPIFYNYDFGRLNENVVPFVPSSLSSAHIVPP
jgi:hypothetical protein